MNKITEVSLFTSNNTIYLNVWRGNSSYPRRHEIINDTRALTIQKILNKSYSAGSTMIFTLGSNLIVHYYPKPTGLPVDAHPVEETGSNFYICPACHKKNSFTAWLFAHWDTNTEHTCACGIKSILKRGKVIQTYPAEGDDYTILVTKYIPAPDNQQIVYVAVAGIANDWAGYVGVFPIAVNSKHAAQQAAGRGVKLFEDEAKGMFPEHTDWNRNYRR